MEIRQTEFASPADSLERLAPLAAIQPQLALVFGAPAYFQDRTFTARLAQALPAAALVGCSTAGEIGLGGVHQDHCVVTAVRFEGASIQVVSTDLANMADSKAAGRRLAEQLERTGLRALMVFGQGIRINGSALIAGLTGVLGPGIPITGGLAGDNGAFLRTWTLGPAGVSERAIVALGLGGGGLIFSHGSFGGWEPFGPARRVTRCEGNILFELDGVPALGLYKRYLGAYAQDLPASGLLFPLAMLSEDRAHIGIIRTILGIDETDGSLILAGEINPGGYLQLMHASTDRLVDGAESAAQAVLAMRGGSKRGLGVLVSCVGRKLVMGDRVEEEVDAVAATLGATTRLTGFYSYGEISPAPPEGACGLHNQTMTITFLGES